MPSPPQVRNIRHAKGSVTASIPECIGSQSKKKHTQPPCTPPEYLQKKKKNRTVRIRSFLLVGTVGIEPMTSCMSSMRSNQLSYAPA